VSIDDTPNFLMRTSRPRGSYAEKRRAPTEAGRRAGRQRRCDAVRVLAIGIPRVKGGISAMAKKAAKGGKKKGGKKR
jgi:hypothetical protein